VDSLTSALVALSYKWVPIGRRLVGSHSWTICGAKKICPPQESNMYSVVILSLA